MTTLHMFVGFFFIIGGAVWLVLFGIPIWFGISSRCWPTIEGEILESSVVPDEDSFRPKVKYRYSIGDVEYMSETLTYRGYEASREVSEIMASPYQPGNKVMVYYNPRHPNWAILEPGVTHPKYLVPMIIPVVLITFGVLTLLGVL